MTFTFFMLAEYSAMLVNCCLMVTLFFGGWTLAMFGHGLTSSVLRHWGWVGGILGTFIFFVKVIAFMMVYIWFRATFPRFRFDQLMDLGWKWMIPLALANIALTAVIVLAFPNVDALGERFNIGEVLLTLGGVAVIAFTLYLLRPRRV